MDGIQLTTAKRHFSLKKQLQTAGCTDGQTDIDTSIINMRFIYTADLYIQHKFKNANVLVVVKSGFRVVFKCRETLLCVLVARPRRCLTLSNLVPSQNWMAAYLGYTLQIKTVFSGWPVIVHNTHMRRRRMLTEEMCSEQMCWQMWKRLYQCTRYLSVSAVHSA